MVQRCLDRRGFSYGCGDWMVAGSDCVLITGGVGGSLEAGVVSD